MPGEHQELLHLTQKPQKEIKKGKILSLHSGEREKSSGQFLGGTAKNDPRVKRRADRRQKIDIPSPRSKRSTISRGEGKSGSRYTSMCEGSLWEGGGPAYKKKGLRST